jgi:hypothetical protein
VPNRLTAAALALAGLGALLWALVLAGGLLHDYYLLRPWLHHPLIFGIGGGLMLAAAWVLGIRQMAVKLVGVVLLLSAVVVGVGLVWLGFAFSQRLTELSRLSAPDGAMELIVYEGQNIIDPTWELRVRTHKGLLSRESDLGCVNSDVLALEDIDWVAPRTLRAYLSRGETVDLTLDDRGRPAARLERGC